MDSHEMNEQPRSATNGGTSGGGGGGAVRRRPHTEPYAPTSHSYGTNEEDSLLYPQRHNEEGYPFPQMDRRGRSYGGGRYPPPWYRQPQKLILGATLAWVGGVMYLASLAHAILKTHKETATMMGNSLVDDREGFKQFLESRGKPQKKHGSSHAKKKKYGSGSAASDEDVKEWIQKRNSRVYGSSAETDEDFQTWLASRNKYGDGDGGGDGSGTYDDFQQWMANQYDKYSDSDGDFQQWMESQYSKIKNNYGSSDETISDFQQWKENISNKYGSPRGGTPRGGTNEATNVRFGNGNGGNGDAWQDWLEYLEREKAENSAASSSGYGSTASGSTMKDVNGVPEEWLEYKHKNEGVKYNANGMYGNSPNGVPALGASRSAQESSSLSSEQQPLAVAASPDPSVSTIDWPVQGMGLSHTSCTSSNGCSPNTNVTVLIVYGPEYHTHISEMAWNVATGVHTAFQSHIRHHPSSPLHGHIVYGHTSNLTFLDVMDADAVIIGSPVYNGNVHPDVQNWINYWHIDADLSNKFGGAFATAGGIHAGADGTIMSILRSMMVFQMMAVGGDSWTSPFGAVATMYEDPFGDTQRTDYFDSTCYFTQDNGRQGDHLVHPYFLRKAYGLGERISNVTVAWKNSSYVRWS